MINHFKSGSPPKHKEKPQIVIIVAEKIMLEQLKQEKWRQKHIRVKSFGMTIYVTKSLCLYVDYKGTERNKLPLFSIECIYVIARVKFKEALNKDISL